jgi:hypothetical protein
VFAWVGARVPRPLVAGLVFALGWEPAVLVFPGYLKHLTVAWYLQGLVPHALPQDDSVSSLLQSLTTVPPAGLSLAVLAAVSVAGVWAAGLAVSRREYVLEQ